METKRLNSRKNRIVRWIDSISETISGMFFLIGFFLFSLCFSRWTKEEIEDFEESRNRIKHYEERVGKEIEQEVTRVINDNLKLAPKNFGIQDRFPPLAFFHSWDSLRMLAESGIDANAMERFNNRVTSIEIFHDGSLYAHYENDIRIFPAEMVLGEVSYALLDWKGSNDDARKFVNWIRVAIILRKELGVWHTKFHEYDEPWKLTPDYEGLIRAGFSYNPVELGDYRRFMINSGKEEK